MKNKNIIGIYSYEGCNLRSLENALKTINLNYEISNIFEDLIKFNKIIFPGVGNMKNIKSDKMRKLSKEIFKYSNDGGIIYGICLGLQMFFEYSKESETNTLGLIKGNSIPIKENYKLKLNVSFNKLEIDKNHLNNKIIKNLFKDISYDSKFYFLHSYYCENRDKDSLVINSKLENKLLPSVFIKRNLIGTQFHPELSKDPGLKFLKNFSNL